VDGEKNRGFQQARVGESLARSLARSRARGSPEPCTARRGATPRGVGLRR